MNDSPSRPAVRPVVLCGGKGTRLWPLSRECHPKQFIEFSEGVTLLGATLGRLERMQTAPAIVICNNDYRFLAAQELVKSTVSGTVVLEPQGRNTAPAVAVAALMSEPEELLLVMPADHALEEGEGFPRAVARAIPDAARGRLVCFGVRPRGPETNFGYLRRGEPLGESVHAVSEFREKPDQATAEAYLQSGDYYWNAGIFLFTAKAYLEALERCAPAMLAACRAALEGAQTDIDFLRLAEVPFLACPADSIDYAVMEHSDNLSMVEIVDRWGDMGSWASFRDAEPRDADGNVAVGDVLSMGTRNCLLHSRGSLLAVLGLEDAVVVRTEDAVLVAANDHLDKVPAVVRSLLDAGRSEAAYHPTVHRPWGSYCTVAQGERFQVKRIMVKPGQTLSLQKHHHRAEHWVVVTGTAQVTNGEEELFLTEDQSTYIPIGNVHRLHNPGSIPLELVEVQTGSYLGEDDIVRLEDVYGRKGETPREH